MTVAKSPSSKQNTVSIPLAERLRPQTLGEVIGQQHLHRNKAVNYHIKQGLGRAVVQIIGLSGGSEGWNHG